VKLTELPADAKLPEGAIRPAKTGTIQIGPDQRSWVNILVTADPAHPLDLARLYVDQNRNGNFTDDGPVLAARYLQNDKTKAWWASFDTVGLSIPYADGISERYMVNLWSVRDGETTPDVIRFSRSSWRSGTVKVDGIDALVAVMDANNDAVFNANDFWSVMAASEKDAANRVLTLSEAKPGNRLMFLPDASGKELVLQFRNISPDGRSLTFAVIDRPVTKAQDRAADDVMAVERARPRTQKPFPWIDANFDKAMAQAKESGRKLIVDFWTSWCGPCKSLDEWIWTDAEVAGVMNAGYVGVKLDGDLEKDLVKRFRVTGYPTVIILDPSGQELQRFFYLGSKEMLAALKR
jgi:thiol-disulfide isomerase/thioredoxin